VQLAQSVPNLRSLTFEFDGEITNTGMEALTRMEKIEELTNSLKCKISYSILLKFMYFILYLFITGGLGPCQN